MIIRKLAYPSIVVIVAALATGSAMSADFATKDEAIAMVKKAVVFINENGEDKAYAEFSKKGGLFHDRDLYITVLGLDGKVLAHGQRADFVGQNLMGAKDPDGKLFIRERSELAQKNPAFWQTYKFSNPTTQKIEEKDMYCERRGDTNVCGGIYKTGS